MRACGGRGLLGALGVPVLFGLHTPEPVSGRCEYRDRPDSVWTLPGSLKEISGLAFAGDRLLAHDDERGLIYHLDHTSGRVLASWPLQGEPRDDFEGIASDGARLFLLTSKGLLYTTAVPVSAGPLPFTVRDTRLGRECEFEGLAWDPVSRLLLLPCKEIRGRARGVALRIYRWDPAREAPGRPATIEVSAAALLRAASWHEFAPSAVELDPRTGHLLLLSSRRRGMVELSPGGAVVATRSLDRRYHRQPEGLALTPAGDMLVSDEASGARPTLSLYRCR